MNNADSSAATRPKRPRKSRGRGLRTKTGCLTCRKRHKKCDEGQPICGPCTISSRQCVYPHDVPADESPQPPPQPTKTAIPSPNNTIQPSSVTSPPELTALPQPLPPPPRIPHPHTHHHHRALDRHPYPIPPRPESASSHSPGAGTPHSLVLPPLNNSPQVQHRVPEAGLQVHQLPSPLPFHDPLKIGYSPETVSSEVWTADFASTRWLDLLTNDAAQADSGFSLSLAPSPAPDDRERGAKVTTILPPIQTTPSLMGSQPRPADSFASELERKSWQAEKEVTLTNHEAGLLRHFSDRCARWLDLFDSSRLFSAYAVRLALRNTGLMKAILALAAKHRSRIQGNNGSASERNNRGEDTEDNEWIRYYYETLHFVQEALVFNSYTHSEELLATAIVISAYEMLDESDGSGNWQRHLKGVFWIQRSQDVNGGSGGLRQAVWWAWLRQDLWAAFREKRACFSFWKPVKEIHELDVHGMADRAIYLLSQSVNYCAESRRAEAAAITDPTASVKRKIARDELLAKMDRWRAFLGPEFKPLPTPSGPNDAFTPLWIHPPQFGVALQAFSFAQILIALHSPNLAGFNGYRKMQKTLADSVETICGIAMELKEEGCQILSAQCLFGAGLCVQEPAKREAIISLMEACEARVGWTPMATWRADLRQEWAKADSEMSEPM